MRARERGNPGLALRHRAMTKLGLALLLGLAVGSPGQAQRYGQWWWDGLLSAGQRGYDNAVNGSSLPGYTETQLGGALGLNGYFGHPALGRFRLGIESTATRSEWASQEQRAVSLGYSLGLDLLPLSNFPFHLGFRHGTYDYTIPTGATAFYLQGLPETSTTIEARLRMRRGPFAGTLLSYEQSSYDFADRTLDPERRSLGKLEWVRRFGAFDNRLHLSRETNDYSLADYATERWSANFDQFARLAERWEWQFGLSAMRNAFDFSGFQRQEIDDYRLLWNVARTLRERDQLNLRLEGSRLDQTTGDSTTGYGATVSYRIRPRGRLEIGPYVQYANVSRGDSGLTSAGGGVSLAWSRTGAVDLSLSSAVGYVAVSRDGPDPVSNENDLSWSAGVTLGNGQASRLRQELELEAGANTVRFSRADSLPVPAPPIGEAGAVDEDRLHGRYRLYHQGQAGRLGGWVDWARREATSVGSGERLRNESLMFTLETGYRALSFVANAGESSQAFVGLEDDLRVEFVGASMSWRILRWVDLRASYRADVRHFDALPDLDGARAEAGLTFQIGLVDLRADYFDSREQVAGGLERQSRGFSITLNRRLAGWLPIVTGGTRRGEVR